MGVQLKRQPRLAPIYRLRHRTRGVRWDIRQSLRLALPNASGCPGASDLFPCLDAANRRSGRIADPSIQGKARSYIGPTAPNLAVAETGWARLRRRPH